jgi:spore maturation protein A
MNIIFGLVMLISSVLLLFFNPEGLLSTMITGGQKALDLTLKLVVVYAVWMGLFALLEKTGLSNKFAKLLKPINRLLFGKIPDKANDFMSLNISANILGMSGITTPMGIKSIQELEKHKNTEYAITMFFVINATSIQLIPTSVMALRSSLGSVSPADIILPTVLTTLLSTIIGILLVKIFVKKPRYV